MSECNNIYILCDDEKNKEIRQFSQNIQDDLYKTLEITNYRLYKEEKLPEEKSIIILEARKETKNQIMDFYERVIMINNYILIFLFLDNYEELLPELIELQHASAIFPPYTSNKINYVIRSSIQKSNQKQDYNDKITNFVSDHLENKKKLRELESIFSIYRLVDHERDLDKLFEKALPIIAGAFHTKSKLSIKISFMDKEYTTDNFEISSREFSDKLIDEKQFKGFIVMYVNDDELESFPISIEELNTFSTIRSLLSRALEGIVFEEMNRINFEYSMSIISLFRNFTNDQYSNLETLFKDVIVRIQGLFNSDLCYVLTCNNSNMKKCRIYSIHRLSESGKDEFLSVLKEQIKNRPLISEKETLYLEHEGNSYTAVPFWTDEKILGFVVLGFKNNSKLTRYFQNSLFNMLSEYMSLAIRSFNNLNEIKSYKIAFEQSPVSIVITDLFGKIQYVNPHFEKVTGYAMKDVINQNPRILKSGLQDPDFYTDLWNTITSGENWYGNFQNKCKNGTIIWESASISPIKDNQGKTYSYIAIKEDITKKVLAEENMLNVNQKLIQTQTSLVGEEKLASIGRLAAGVAHELNNPIGFINSNFRTMKRYLDKFQELFKHEEFKISSKLLDLYQTNYMFEDLYDIMQESDEGFKRIINIINSLRSFSRIDESASSTYIDLNELIKTTLIVARNEIKYRADVHNHFGNIPKVYCVASEINQVLLNIIVNAAQAVKSEDSNQLGNIFISTVANEKSVVCRIGDDGPGVVDEDKLKIFDPFYTTKPVGTGTGLGLSISYDIIVNKHKGSLFLEDRYGGGVDFIIELPLGDNNE